MPYDADRFSRIASRYVMPPRDRYRYQAFMLLCFPGVDDQYAYTWALRFHRQKEYYFTDIEHTSVLNWLDEIIPRLLHARS